MDKELIDLLRAVSSGFQGRMQAQIETSGTALTTFQARLVNIIGRTEGISQLSLGAFVDRDKAQVARAVKELEARGLVTRSVHASDWRAKSLALTEEGKRAHAILMALRQQLAEDVLAAFSDPEKHELRGLLQKMEAALRQA